MLVNGAKREKKMEDSNEKNFFKNRKFKSEAAAALTPGTTSTQVGDSSHWTQSGKLINVSLASVWNPNHLKSNLIIPEMIHHHAVFRIENFSF